MSAASAKKQLRLRRADRCVVCGVELSVGELASWDPQSRTVTCLACEHAGAPAHEPQASDVAALDGAPGASAQREYQRRHDRREQHARDKLGVLGVALARVIAEPQSTTSWRQGANGERQTASRLEKHLADHPVKLLHDRRVPGHGQANIDHLVVGPGGVTVIDTKTHKGAVCVEHVGGLLSDRREVLRIAGRDQTKLIDGIERQLDAVRATLANGGFQIDVCGALCFPDPDGLPTFGHLKVRAILIDGPKPIAKLARRHGPLDTDHIERIWRHLATAFPPA